MEQENQENCVWVVEQGNYSDRSVVGVCSTEAYAEAIKTQWPDEYARESIRITKWPLNATWHHLLDGRYGPYRIVMHRNGTVECCVVQEREFVSWYHTHLWIWLRSQAQNPAISVLPDCLTGVVWARDSEHAIKIANDWRIQQLATNQWQ